MHLLAIPCQPVAHLLQLAGVEEDRSTVRADLNLNALEQLGLHVSAALSALVEV